MGFLGLLEAVVIDESTEWCRKAGYQGGLHVKFLLAGANCKGEWQRGRESGHGQNVMRLCDNHATGLTLPKMGAVAAMPL